MKQMVLVALTVTLAVAAALQLSVESVESVSAQRTSGPHSPLYVANPPDALLMKGPFVLQKGRELTRCWEYRTKDGRFLTGGCADYLFAVPRQYVPLPAGIMGRLHIRINNPQRLKWLTFHAYTGYKPYPGYPSAGEPVGKRRLDYTIRRVQRDGKTVAWNVFFRLPRPASHYYLDLYTQWKPSKKAGLSFYDTWYTFHVRTF